MEKQNKACYWFLFFQDKLLLKKNNGSYQIPYPASADYFFKMAELGKRLRYLHELKGIDRTDLITTYPVIGTKDNNVIKAHVYEATNEGIGRVWINKEQYFDGVPSEAWNMIIVGYKSLFSR